MKNKIILALKGAVFGIANIIPGVSGGTIALTMGVYEDLIAAIGHFFEKPKKSLSFLLVFGIGAAISILLMSKLISFSLDKFPLPTMLFFIGLILGGIPLLLKKIDKKEKKPLNIILFIITFLIVIGLSLIGESTKVVNLSTLNIGTILLLLLVGVVASATMIIPGISGSFVLMLLGYYKPIVETISSLTNFKLMSHNLGVLIPFGIGIVIGIVLISKLIEYLFKKYQNTTYYAILGFVIASIITLIVSAFSTKIVISHLVAGILLLVLGAFIGYKLGDE